MGSKPELLISKTDEPVFLTVELIALKLFTATGLKSLDGKTLITAQATRRRETSKITKRTTLKLKC